MRYREISSVLVFLLSATVASPTSAQQDNQGPGLSPPAAMVVSVAVTDRQSHLLAGLQAGDFTLSDDSQPRQIVSVTADAPACVGLLVDNSGSMRSKLPGVTAALLDFVRAGNAGDRFFIVNFNDMPYLDLDFTGDINRIDGALRRAVARGGTALYDATIASADHIAKAPCNKRVLLLITDGTDNESRKSLTQTVKVLQEANGTMIYAIGLDVDHEKRSGRRPLETLTNTTGGRAFFVNDARDAQKALARAAEETRGLYTIAYAGPERPGHLPTVQIVVVGKDAMVRTNIPARAVLPNDGPALRTVPAQAPAKPASDPPK